VNAFEDDNGGINLDIVCYSDDTIAHQLTTANLRDPKSMDPPHLAKHEIRRFYLANIEEESMSFFSNNAVSSVSSTIGDRASSVWSFIKGRVSKPREADIESDSVSSGSGATIPKAAEEIVLPIPLELPQVNASVKGRVYNFVWGLSVAPTGDSNTEGKMWNCIVKAVCIIHSWKIGGSLAIYLLKFFRHHRISITRKLLALGLNHTAIPVRLVLFHVLHAVQTILLTRMTVF
jgi:torulene dioxygenase